MKCFHPLTIIDPRVQGVRREDKDAPRVFVPCGKCVACLSNRRRIWSERLKIETKHSSSALFITLTYDDMYLPRLPTLESTLLKRDVQLFMKKLRYHISKIDKKISLRYYLCGEYGPTTLRPHYHLLLFNFPVNLIDPGQFILSVWAKGFVQCAPLTDGGGNYAAKYIMAGLEYDYGDREKPFSLMSRRPGIGMQLINSERFKIYLKNAKKYYFNTFKNSSVLLPQSFRSKVFSEEEREEIYNTFLLKSYESFQQDSGNFRRNIHESEREAAALGRRIHNELDSIEKKMIKNLSKKHPYSKL